VNFINLPGQTVTRWLWLGFGLLVSVLALTSLIHYWQIQRIDNQVVQIVEVQEPLERAVLEMQTAIDSTAQAISDYTRNRDPADADEVRNSEVNFEKLTVEVSGFAQTGQIDNFSREITKLHEEFKVPVYEILSQVSQQASEISSFRKGIDELDGFIDGMIQPTVDGTSRDMKKKLKATLDMKDSLDEVSIAVDTYLTNPVSDLLENLLGSQENFRKAKSVYGETNLSVYEESWLHHISEQFEETASSSIEIIRITDGLQVVLVQFDGSLLAIDTYLNEQVEPLVHTRAIETSEGVQASAASASRWLLTLSIFGVLIGITTVWIISRNLAKPIRQLAGGAAVVSSGRLEHRFNVDATGEFGQVALALNQMLDGLGRSRDALSESEELAWALLDATNDAVILTDLRGIILASNEVAASRFGLSLEQMIDESIYDLLPAGPSASIRAHIAEVIRSKKSVHYEDEREGKIIEQNIHPVMGNKGEIARLAIFASDITVRKWVEDVTEQLERRNELILQAAGEGIYGLDTQGKTTFVNPSAARMLGYDPEKLIGQLHHEIVHHTRVDGRPYPNEECPVYRAFKDGAVHTNVDDEVFWRKDGTSFPIEYTSTPIIEDGKILGAVVTFQDITDRKWLEKVLRQSEEKYRSMFESVASLIISVDEEGTIIDSNARARQMLDYSPDEIIGRNLTDLVIPNEHQQAREYLEEAINKGFKYNSQFTMVRKDGTFIEASLNAAAVRDANGDYIRTVCMIGEVTQQIKK